MIPCGKCGGHVFVLVKKGIPERRCANCKELSRIPIVFDEEKQPQKEQEPSSGDAWHDDEQSDYDSDHFDEDNADSYYDWTGSDR